jgi:hypothetical protein
MTDVDYRTFTIARFFSRERSECNKWNNEQDPDDYIPFHEWLMDNQVEYRTMYGIEYNGLKDEWVYNGFNTNYQEDEEED